MLNKLQISAEYEKLLKQWKRAQKENRGAPLKKDPLAEFERLFDIWERAQMKIRQVKFQSDVEKRYLDKAKEVEMEENQKLVDRENEKQRNSSKASPNSRYNQSINQDERQQHFLQISKAKNKNLIKYRNSVNSSSTLLTDTASVTNHYPATTERKNEKRNY